MLLDPKILPKIANFEKTYTPLRFAALESLSMEFALTREHFRDAASAEAALSWQPATKSMGWGEDWVSAWFRGSVTIPQALDGQQVFLRPQTGAPESQLIIDGVHRGVVDVNHPVRVLSLKAISGRTHRIHLEAYAGHTFPGTQPFYGTGLQNDPGVVVKPNCRIFEKVELVTERTDVGAFVIELRALHQLMSSLDEHSLRRGKIQAAMQHVFNCVYAKPEDVAESVWRPAISQARAVMKPLLEMKNGPTAPTIGIIGHSHIDTAWLWPIKETWRKCARTFSSILALMDQYPDFQFTQSAAYHSDIVRQLYPEIFARMQQRVKEGRWEINGAMWIEPDCNIPSGESFVRQCLIGQQATREMFGVTSDTLWQPDVFGYSAALPQILQAADVKYFCTTKISWNDTNRFPYDTFHWCGIDGTTIPAHFNTIHAWPDPETLAREWKKVQHSDVQDRRLLAFGYGDGGGGPQAEMIEVARLTRDLEGCPKAQLTTVSAFMQGVERDLGPTLPTYVGELYLELHRGTLTSIAAIKRGNRQCEHALRDAELLCTLAKLNAQSDYPAAALRDAWKILLLNQFHDILPGSSIAEVNDEAIATFAQCLEQTKNLQNNALEKIAPSGKNNAVLLANSLSWERSDEMKLTGIPEGFAPSGAVSQVIEDVAGERQLIVSGITIPSMGYRVVPLVAQAKSSKPSPIHVNDKEVETPFAKVKFDAVGRIISFFDKSSRRELVRAGRCFNELLMGEDVPSGYDNWDIDRDQRHKLQPQTRLVSRRVVAEGPLQLRIRQEYQLGQHSTLVQHIVFHASTPRVDFETRVDWHEKYQFLKTGFAVDVLAEQARHEIQFGHVQRSTHDNTTLDRAQFDVCAHKWSDLSEGTFGVAFLNDCKYACTIKEGVYQLSLIKSGRHPDARGDEGVHRFAYAMLPHLGSFSVENVVRPAYEFNLAPVAHATNAPPQTFSLVSVDAANVIIESVKWAEQGNAFVLRLYEAGKTGTHVKVKLHRPVKLVQQTNLLEEKPQSIAMQQNEIELYLRPFKIVTLRCELA